MKSKFLFTALTVAAAFAGAASANTIYSLTDGQNLIAFDSATPGTVSLVGSVGAGSGVLAGHVVQSIDFRPATAGSGATLYALSTQVVGGVTQAAVYTVSLQTGALTQIGSGTIALGTGVSASNISIDFNPFADRLRVVAATGQSWRINQLTGALAGTDTSLTYSMGGGSPIVAGVGYNNNNSTLGVTPTTLYAYDALGNNLVTIGGLNGIPSPNGGLVSVVGPTGITSSINVGLDIGNFMNFAVASAQNALGVASFYNVNLDTGAFGLVGIISPTFGNPTDLAVTAVPEPTTVVAGVLALGGVALHIRRRRQAAQA